MASCRRSRALRPSLANVRKRFSWYRPITDADAMKRAIDYVLNRKNVFINTSSDATLLEQLSSVAQPRARAICSYWRRTLSV